jgi:hypothetical protein
MASSRSFHDVTGTLVPTFCTRPTAIPLVSEQDHAAACTDERCSRCFFWSCFHGHARQGRAPVAVADLGLAWKTRFVFHHSGKQVPWVCTRPVSWGGPWAIGCWPCNAAQAHHPTTKLARVAGVTIDTTALDRHQRSATHMTSIKQLSSASADEVRELLSDPGVLVSCARMDVPRLDRWLIAAASVQKYEAFADVSRSANVSDVGSSLCAGETLSDTSPQVAKKLILCLAEPLRWRDFEALQRATHAAIGIDERDSILLVYARIFMGKSCELYECLLGAARGSGTLPEDCLRTIDGIVRRACSLPFGRQHTNRKPNETKDGKLIFCESTYNQFRHAVRSAVADGGNVEQRALFEASPGAMLPSRAADPLFPNLVDIARDKAHKLRSVQKGVWKGLDEDLRDFLNELVTGEGSLARMLQTSKKYQVLFEAIRCEKRGLLLVKCGSRTTGGIPLRN